VQKDNTMEPAHFSPESERYMIDHMNEDHADANLMYAKVYGRLWQATAARMVTLDKAGMDLEVTVPAGVTRLRIPFDHHLEDATDAERTLVAMAFKARDVLAQAAPPSS
jgi:putative heme iron utilization protein